MRKSFLLSGAFLCSVMLFSQTPCENGFAGNYPCDGYDLMSQIPLSTLSGNNPQSNGNDSWGWTDPDTGKEYAIVGLTTCTAFVDISDPVNPVYLGRVETETFSSTWRDIKVYNNHAFIVADAAGPHGMQVFDLTRLRNVTPPTVFEADARYAGVNSCHNIVIHDTQPYAYLVGCDNEYGGGPEFVDISNPMNPVGVGGYGGRGYTHDAQVVTYNGPDADHTGKEIYVGSNGAFGSNNRVIFLDVTDKANPVLISEINYDSPGYTHQGWLTEGHDYFLLGDELDELDFGINTRTVVFDIQDLDNPQVHYEYYGPTEAIDHNGYVLGNTFYLANYTAGLRVIDLSNISSTTNSITEVGYFDTYPSGSIADFDGAWSVYPYFESENIVISDISRGFFLVRKSDGTMGVNDLNVDSFNIYPNPATTTAKIVSGRNAKIENVKLYSILGQEVLSKTDIGRKDYTIQLNGLSKGVYIVKINDSVSKKLIVK